MRGALPDYSDETLLGYLLGGLSDSEASQVESALAASESLRMRLADLRSLLEPMAALDPLAPDSLPPDSLPPDSMAAEHAHRTEPSADLINQTMALIAIRQSALDADSSRALSDPSPVEWSEASIATRLAWLDSLVALAAGIIFLSFLLPTVWQWRESSRRVVCADNLRNLGRAFSTFANFSFGRSIPPIDTAGPMTFAGVYALRLHDRQLLDSIQWIQCPSNRVFPLLQRIPTTEEFLADTPEQQQFWRYMAGGDYAFHLGSLVNGKYQTASLDAPARIAVIGDMWPANGGAVHASNRPIMLHGDRAVNVLYNDGSTHLLHLLDKDRMAGIDNPFLNSEMKQAVGIGLKDACLAPSYWLPAAYLNHSD